MPVVAIDRGAEFIGTWPGPVFAERARSGMVPPSLGLYPTTQMSVGLEAHTPVSVVAHESRPPLGPDSKRQVEPSQKTKVPRLPTAQAPSGSVVQTLFSWNGVDGIALGIGCEDHARPS